MRAFWCMAAAGVAASAASAQFTLEASVALALTWRDSGNDNGVLEPGESALLSVTAILTPEVGSVITPGTLRGIAWSTFDLRSFNLNGATWPSQSIHPLWDLVGPGNISQDGNSILKVQFGQFPFSLGEINPTNPIESAWNGTMTPLSYSQRTAVIQIGFSQSLEGAESAVYIQTGVPNPTSFSTYATRSVYSSVSIPVIPAPACTVVLGLGACIAARRKRG